MQAPVAVELGVGAEGLHHCLVVGLGVVGAFHNHIAIGQHGLDVAAFVGRGAHEVARIVAAQIAQHAPVVFGMHEHRVVFGGAEVQNGFEYVVGNLDALERLIGGCFIFGSDDCHHVAYEANVAIDDEAVVGARFGVGLARVRKALVRHVFPREYVNHAGDLFRLRGVDSLDDSIGVRASQQLYHERIAHDIFGIQGLAQQLLHRVFLADRLAHRLVLGSIHGWPLPHACCSGRRGCRAADLHSPSSGTGCRSGTREFPCQTGRGFREAARWYS